MSAIRMSRNDILRARRACNKAHKLAAACGVVAEEIKTVRYRLERLLPPKPKRTPGQVLGAKVDRALSVRELDNKLWPIFAKYIKLRDSDGRGLGSCITCGAVVWVWCKENDGTIHWNQNAQCGHYIGRQHKAVKYNEQNNHLQCSGCNCFEEGNHAAYRAALVKRYGAQAVLLLDAGKNARHTESQEVYKAMIAHYTAKLEGLKRERGIG